MLCASADVAQTEFLARGKLDMSEPLATSPSEVELITVPLDWTDDVASSGKSTPRRRPKLSLKIVYRLVKMNHKRLTMVDETNEREAARSTVIDNAGEDYLVASEESESEEMSELGSEDVDFGDAEDDLGGGGGDDDEEQEGALRSGAAGNDARVAELEKKLALKEEVLSSVREALRTEVNQSKAKIDALETQLSEAKSGGGEQAAELDALKEQLKEAKKQKKEADEVRQERDLLQTTLKSTTAALSEADAMKSELESARTALGDVEALKAELETAKAQLADTESVKSELSDAKAQLDGVESLKSELEQMTGAVDALKAELASAQGAQTQLEDDNRELKSLLDASSASNDSVLDEQLGALRKSLKDAETRAEQLEREASEREKASKDQSRKVQELEDQCDALTAELDDANDALQKARKLTVDAEAEVAELETQLEDTQERVKTLESESERATERLVGSAAAAGTAELVKLQATHAKLGEQFDALKHDHKAELEAREATLDELKAQLAAAQESAGAASGELANQVQTLKEEAQAAAKESAELKAKLAEAAANDGKSDELVKQIDTLNEEAQKAAAEMSELKAKLADAEAAAANDKSDQLAQEVKDVQAQLLEAEKSAALQLDNKLAELRAELESELEKERQQAKSASERAESLQVELESGEKQVQKLQEKADRLSEELNAERERGDSESDRADALSVARERIKELEDELEAAEDNAEEMDDELRAKQKEVDGLKEEIKEIHAAHEDAEAEHRDECEVLRATVEDLETDVAELNKECETLKLQAKERVVEKEEQKDDSSDNDDDDDDDDSTTKVNTKELQKELEEVQKYVERLENDNDELQAELEASKAKAERLTVGQAVTSMMDAPAPVAAAASEKSALLFDNEVLSFLLERVHHAPRSFVKGSECPQLASRVFYQLSEWKALESDAPNNVRRVLPRTLGALRAHVETSAANRVGAAHSLSAMLSLRKLIRAEGGKSALPAHVLEFQVGVERLATRAYRLFTEQVCAAVEPSIVPGMLVAMSSNEQLTSTNNSPHTKRIVAELDVAVRQLEEQHVPNSINAQMAGAVFQFVAYTVCNTVLGNNKRKLVYSTPQNGFKIKLESSLLDSWCSRRDKDYGERCRAALQPCLQLATALVMDKSILADTAALNEICPLLNYRMVLELVKRYKPDQLSSEPVPKSIPSALTKLIKQTEAKQKGAKLPTLFDIRIFEPELPKK